MLIIHIEKFATRKSENQINDYFDYFDYCDYFNQMIIKLIFIKIRVTWFRKTKKQYLNKKAVIRLNMLVKIKVNMSYRI